MLSLQLLLALDWLPSCNAISRWAPKLGRRPGKQLPLPRPRVHVQHRHQLVYKLVPVQHCAHRRDTRAPCSALLPHHLASFSRGQATGPSACGRKRESVWPCLMATLIQVGSGMLVGRASHAAGSSISTDAVSTLSDGVCPIQVGHPMAADGVPSHSSMGTGALFMASPVNLDASLPA